MRLHLTFESIDMADGDFRDIDARDRRSAVLSMTLIAESASLSPSSLASSMVCLLGYLNNDDPTSHRVAAHGTRAERSDLLGSWPASRVVGATCFASRSTQDALAGRRSTSTPG